MGKPVDFSEIKMNLDGVPEHLRDMARERIRQFLDSPEGATVLAEAMASGMNRGGMAWVQIPTDDEDAPPYPPLSPEAETLNGLLALDIGPDGEEWDGETDARRGEIGEAIAALRHLTEPEKRDAYALIVKMRALSIDYNECWEVCHRQLTIGHHLLVEDEPGACSPRLHSYIDLGQLRDVTKTLSPNLANFGLMVVQMTECDTALRGFMALIDKRAHEAGEWPLPSPVNADPA